MEAAVDFYFAVPFIFTVLAVILASVFVKLRSPKEDNKAATEEPDGGKEETTEEAQVEKVEEKKEVEQKEENKEIHVKEDPVEEVRDMKGEQEAPRGIQVEDIGTEDQILRVEEEEDQEESATAAATEEVEQQSTAQGFTVSQILAGLKAEDIEEADGEAEGEAEHEKLVEEESGNDAEMEHFSFQYNPGKLRGSHFETMMTKEELEEEQRVQREQLAAIFELMKENQETFGPMSEVDVKEQLKLYDM